MAGQRRTVGDLVTVEVLVLQRLKPALDDAVGLRRPVAGAHVLALRPRRDVALKAGGAVAGAVVGDDDDRQDLAGLRVGEIIDERRPSRSEARSRAVSSTATASGQVFVGLTGQQSASLAT